MKKFLRVCCECGDAKEVTYRPKKDTLCRSCRAKKFNPVQQRWKKKPKVLYYYFCRNCESVKMSNVKKRKCYCGDCSRIFSKKPYFPIVFDFVTMKMIEPLKHPYDRVCKICGDVKRYKVKTSYDICQSCSSKIKREKVLKRGGGKRTASKEAIKKQRKINQEHRENIKAEVEIPKQKLSDEEMIARFYKTKKPSVRFSDD